MNKTYLIVGLITVIILLLFIFSIKPVKFELNNTERNQDSSIPKHIVENDKFILIKKIQFEHLEQAIQQFCNNYNKDKFLALPRLYKFENEYVITFPYDVSFEYYCYFINYLEYPHELTHRPDYKPEIKAWSTTKINDKWMKPEIVDKKVMIFIPEWDEENDNVYLTTENNKCFLMGFAIGESGIKLKKTIFDYESNPILIKDLKNKEFIDYE
ncbi:hypothetical protein SAMN05444411_1461 [Lutibacter oricola]|uniref:Uncharacterized protein n=1 Tax=Lutibacter oricola TaxID=762486 RepID=A0A1H3HLU8_9FLAO|nr:hypothetical protein [Lutibacter oricola]SDY16483.1 hypothetical protein SAMN05444411_1461 [Lutibacter oricola]